METGREVQPRVAHRARRHRGPQPAPWRQTARGQTVDRLGDRGHADRRHWILILVGLLGAALFYGNGMITPAISVLSAVEGTEVATEAFDGFVVPIAVADDAIG